MSSKIWQFLCFPWKKLRKTEKSHEILDRAMSRWRYSPQVVTSYQEEKLHSHVRDKILGKVTEGIFKICYPCQELCSKKSAWGYEFTPPPLVLCVLILVYCAKPEKQPVHHRVKWVKYRGVASPKKWGVRTIFLCWWAVKSFNMHARDTSSPSYIKHFSTDLRKS